MFMCKQHSLHSVSCVFRPWFRFIDMIIYELQNVCVYVRCTDTSMERYHLLIITIIKYYYWTRGRRRRRSWSKTERKKQRQNENVNENKPHFISLYKTNEEKKDARVYVCVESRTSEVRLMRMFKADNMHKIHACCLIYLCLSVGCTGRCMRPIAPSEL